MGYLNGLWSTIYIVFIASIVLFLAYIVTKFVGTKYKNTLKGKNISVLETTSLGIDKTLYLIQVGSQHFLISSSGKNVNLLSEIESSNITINIEEPTNQPVLTAGNTFTKYLEKFKNIQKTSDKDDIKEYEKSTSENVEKIDKNVEKIRDIFNNIKVSNEDGVE